MLIRRANLDAMGGRAKLRGMRRLDKEQ
jgi:hypothetical protein